MSELGTNHDPWIPAAFVMVLMLGGWAFGWWRGRKLRGQEGFLGEGKFGDALLDVLVAAEAQGGGFVATEAGGFVGFGKGFTGEAGLGEVHLVAVDPEHTIGTTALHLDAVKAAVAADVEHRLSTEVFGDRMRETRELRTRIISEEMVGRRLDSAEVHVVEPRPERFDLSIARFSRRLRRRHRSVPRLLAHVHAVHWNDRSPRHVGGTAP